MGSTELLAAGLRVPAADLGADFWADQGKNLLFGAVAIVAFIAIVALIMFGADLIKGRARDRVQLVVLVAPVLILLGIGLVYPAIDTAWLSFNEISQEPDPDTGIYTTAMSFVGLDNYRFAFTDPGTLRTILNTFVWMILVPLLSTGFGLAYAVFIDKAKGEKVLKSLVFMPMAISLVGASVIWGNIMYDYNQVGEQTGMLNALREPVRHGPLQLPARQPVEHLLAHRHPGVDSDRFRDGDSLGSHQGCPAGDERGGVSRRRQRVAAVLEDHHAVDPLHDCGGPHHDHDHGAQGLRHCPHGHPGP
ncbi:hypothetical protein GCM10025876_15750 [Demequina litorisediminis]|uniref:Uncharacterized protein n=1 Tax=Demequina litorisediminis TaxID=1849022 RepID=A0ABQ6IDU6_9MICO|nr:hypothetical protein GCM10025876_15750 [Demequina litorisediminis]